MPGIKSLSPRKTSSGPTVSHQYYHQAPIVKVPVNKIGWQAFERVTKGGRARNLWTVFLLHRNLETDILREWAFLFPGLYLKYNYLSACSYLSSLLHITVDKV